MADKDEQFLREFLTILGKEDCARTEKKIRVEFGLYPENPEKEEALERLQSLSEKTTGPEDEEFKKAISEYYSKYPEDPDFMRITSTYFITTQTIDASWEQQFRKEIKPFSIYQDFQKKIEKAQKDLMELLAFTENQDIQKFFELTGASEDHYEGFDPEEYKKIFKDIRRVYMKLYKFSYKPPTKLGRPSLEKFYEFVLHMAELYEELSGEEFTADRNKETDGVCKGLYTPITDGQRFVWKAVEWLHYFAKDIMESPMAEFSSKNIMNACERAVKNLP